MIGFNSDENIALLNLENENYSLLEKIVETTWNRFS